MENEVTNPNHSKNINVISSINTQPVSGNTSETPNMTKDNKTKIPTVAKDFYQIPTRREYLGMVGYYRKFINRFTDAARPLTKLTQKDCKFIWSDECQTGFEYLRTCLTESPRLKYPDPHKGYVVFTDASDQAAAAVLTQECIDNDGQMKKMPVAYLSAQFNDTQFKWSTVVKEGYAIYHAIKKWRYYLEDAEFLLKSDAKSLQKFLNGKTDNLKLDRWSLELQGRNIKVEHIPSYKNKAADCLSWLPFITRRRNDNPLKDKDTGISVVQTENDTICCPLCEVDLARSFFYYGSQFGRQVFVLLFFLSVLNFWGMFVRVYPKIVQGLTFLNSVKHITIILARCTS